jgi:hypothetical protein
MSSKGRNPGPHAETQSRREETQQCFGLPMCCYSLPFLCVSASLREVLLWSFLLSVASVASILLESPNLRPFASEVLCGYSVGCSIQPARKVLE